MRTSRLKVGMAVLGGLLLLAQAFRIERTNPPERGDVPATEEVKALLRRACYDCHSNETAWPWYAQVAPASWLLAHDVHEGRDELNYSTWESYRADRRAKLSRETAEQVAAGAMPPWYYRLVHPEARLSPDEVAMLGRWATDLAKPR